MPAGDFPLVEELTPAPDVPSALRALADRPGVLLFDSALRREPLGRYSFLSADPGNFEVLPGDGVCAPLAGTDEPASHTEGGHVPTVIDPLRACPPLERLRAQVARFPTASVPGLPPFQGGAAGFLSYDLGRCWERIPPPGRDEFRLPALAVGIYDWVLAWDHLQNRAWIIAHGFPEVDPGSRRERARRRIAEVRAALDRSPERAGSAFPIAAPELSLRDLAPQFTTPGPPGLTSDFSRDDYLAAVGRAIEYIRAGDIFQVNLSQRLLVAQRESPLEVYLRLRECNPAPFAGYFAYDDWAIASASPERFVRVAGDDVETRPIKGTRRRRPVPEADLFTRDELRESAKDQAENVMIVDLLRNDLSRVCRPGSIRVAGLCKVESYETVQHLVSEIHGRLRPGKTAWDLIPAVFPGGSITGAPKVRAMEIIAELEPTARGPYCGSLFYIGFDGQADSNILIRTFTLRHGYIQCPVGGGIVAQSDPAAEYAETWHKAEGMLGALV
jgi:para-aminobenzoate synthetase component 1